MKLPPLLLPLLASPLRARALAAALAEAEPPLPTHRDAAEPDWRNAYQRLREQDLAEPEAPPPVAPVLARASREPAAETTEVRGVSTTPTVERVEALRQLAEPSPAVADPARAWQVELPASTGIAWQLRVEQAQPQAPLNLELRAPAVLQTQARQQLADLDKRLRDAGHDVLRSRLRDSPARADRRQRPIDEVES